ncbi:M60 family metallopeptidase [Enterococcus faecalis]|uniref:M60 family metallopeptidase n=1 Tax=Enterococcus faecalis TaxID=1351 RepID=UPI003D0AC4E7
MKKYFLGILICSTILMSVCNIEEVHSQENTPNVISEELTKNKRKEISLYQSDSADTYARDILKNGIGFSENQSTGLYKRVEDTITIYVDETTEQETLPVYIISPTALKKYNQGADPGIKLKKGKNVISDNSEGIIHLRNLSSETKSGKINIIIEGGTHLPTYTLGETSQKEWEEQLKKYPNAPGYELIGKNTLITGSKATIHLIKNPELILKTQDDVTDMHNKTHGLDNSSEKHRLSRGLVQHMRETSENGYWMYAFYKHTAYHTNAMIRVLQPDTEDQWGIWHEFGHTYQKEPMTWSSLGEVTVNIYSMRAEKERGVRSRLEREGIYDEIFKFLEQDDKDYNSELMAGKHFIKLGMFWQLELAFGDDFYPNLHKQYREENKTFKLSNTQKQEYFMLSASRIANINLTPFFKKWGLVPSLDLEKELNKLPMLTKKIWQLRDEMTNEVDDIEKEENNKMPKEALNINNLKGQSNDKTIQLVWKNAYSDWVKHFEIYRDDKKIANTTSNRYTDITAIEGGKYQYKVRAISHTGVVGEFSDAIELEIKAEESEQTEDQELEWNSNDIYIGGNRVRYNGKIYEAKWWTRGESPKDSDVWNFLPKNNNDIIEWDAKKAYCGGDKVKYNGKIYEAKWWTRDSNPEVSDVWMQK